jgi:hypothetical protein
MATIARAENTLGVRGIVGWESAYGLGLRTRFWGSGADIELDTAGSGPDELDLGVGRFDFDVYRRFRFDHGSLVAGAAIAAGHLDFDYQQVLTVEEGGGGVGFFLEARHQFYETDVSVWSVLARGRMTELIGEWEQTRGGSGLLRADSNLLIGEGSLGLEYRRKLVRTDFVMQYSIEAQHWNCTFLDDVGFLGSTLSFGFSR